MEIRKAGDVVAAVFGRKKRGDSGSGRSLRLGLLVCLTLFCAGPGWTQADSPPDTGVTLGLVGDILPDRGVKTVIRREGLNGVFRNLPEILGGSDLVCANLEASVTSERQSLVKTFRFNSPLTIGQYLTRYKISAVNLANNHSVDYGKTGLKETVARLIQDGVTPFGYGDDAAAALSPRIIVIKGVKIAFIGAVCFPLEGYVYLPDSFDVGRWDRQLIGEQIRKARNMADFVVVSLHWGVEFSHYPAASQVEMGHYCIEQGADLIAGHHPHVLQGIEIYRGKPIFYSLGNFVFDQGYDPTQESVFIQTEISNHRIKKLKITPVKINGCVPEKASGETAATILGHLNEYSRPFEHHNAGAEWIQ